MCTDITVQFLLYLTFSTNMPPPHLPWLTNTNTDSALFFFRTLPTPEQNPLYASDDRRSTISRKIHACLERTELSNLHAYEASLPDQDLYHGQGSYTGPDPYFRISYCLQLKGSRSRMC